MIGVLTIALLTAEFGQAWAEYGVMTSRHSCGENQTVKGRIQGDNCNKDVTHDDITPRHSCGENQTVNKAFRGITVIKM